jgi:hypothetical protein
VLVERLHERPDPAFAVARAVLPVAVGLVDRFVLDRRALLACVTEVRIDVVDHDGDARRGRAQGARRRQTERRRLRVQPHHAVAGLELSVNDVAVDEQVVGERAVRPAHGAEELGEPAPQPARRLQSALEIPQLRRHRGAQTPRRIVERPADLAEGQPEAAEETDPYDLT